MKKILITASALLLNFIVLKAQPSLSLWATTCYGGPSGGGVLFSTSVNGTGFTHVCNFQVATGCTPYGNLIQASDGYVYGTTENGGPSGSCVIYRVDPHTGAYTDLHDFWGPDGYVPFSGLVEESGKLYGVTYNGGLHSVGVIYSYDPSTGVYTDLHDFDTLTGGLPYGALTAYNGKLYGMTLMGGNRDGVIFRFDPVTSAYTVLHNFDSATEGYLPHGSLLHTSDGIFYGLNLSGGAHNFGTLFCFNETSGVLTDLHDFDSINGSLPYASLIEDAGGKLYGTASSGGSTNSGVVFTYDRTSHQYNVVHDFNGTDGRAPDADLLRSPNGLIYGTTSYGGANGNGTVFSIDPVSSVFSVDHDMTQQDGWNSQSGFCLVDYSLGVKENFPSVDLQLFPSPAHETITIRSDRSMEGCNIVIRDITCKVILSYTEESGIYSDERRLNIAGLPPGIYLLELRSGKDFSVKKFVKE